MLLLYYVALLASISLGIVGQLFLKTAAVRAPNILQQLIDRFTILGFAAYAISAILYIIALRRLPLSVAFPSVSLSYVVIAVASFLIWHEALGWSRQLGIAIIIIGVMVLSYKV